MAGRWMKRLPLTRGDKVLIGILLALSVASLFVIRSIISSGDVAMVEVGGRPICRLDLTVDTRRSVQGPLGETVVEVRGGRVRIAESPCPHQICVRTGWIERAGSMVVCLPNRVVVRVEGKSGVDAVSW
jgi:hypothetical protein